MSMNQTYLVLAIDKPAAAVGSDMLTFWLLSAFGPFFEPAPGLSTME